MSTPLVNTINFNTPFLQGVPNSRVAPEWIRLLGAIVSTVVQQQTDLGSDLSDYTYTLRTTENLPSWFPKDSLFGQSKSNTASASTLVQVNDEVTTNQTMLPLFCYGTNAQLGIKSSSTNWTYNPSTGTMTSAILVSVGAFGCNGATPQTSLSLGAVASDLGTVIALANKLRTMAINNGIGKA